MNNLKVFCAFSSRWSRRRFAAYSIALLLLGSMSTGPLLAQTSTASAITVDMPDRGILMSEVEKQFGAPLARVAAIGVPPISIWHYDHFSVYFEADRVIHAVKIPQ